jgi:hypothetical protein
VPCRLAAERFSEAAHGTGPHRSIFRLAALSAAAHGKPGRGMPVRSSWCLGPPSHRPLDLGQAIEDQPHLMVVDRKCLLELDLGQLARSAGTGVAPDRGQADRPRSGASPQSQQDCALLVRDAQRRSRIGSRMPSDRSPSPRSSRPADPNGHRTHTIDSLDVPFDTPE